MADDSRLSDDASHDELPEPPLYMSPYQVGDIGYEAAENSGYYGIMHADGYEWGNVKCTAEAYGEYDPDAHPAERRQTIDGQPRRSLKFHTTWMGVEEAQDCLREIGTYNRFDAFYVRSALERMPDAAKYVVGRESSPVIYVWTTRPVEAWDVFESIRKPFDYEDCPGWVDEPEDGQVPIGPDELGAHPNAGSYPVVTVGKPKREVEPGEPTLLRAWWD